MGEAAFGEFERRAVRRHGLIDRSEALAAGFSSSAIGRRVASGRWSAVYAGVYRLSTAPQTWRQRVLAACMWSGGVASHQTAAHLWGFGDRPRDVEVLVGRRKSRRNPGVVVHRSHRLSEADRGVRDEIPLTNVPRTLLDLASELDDEPLELALNAALRWNKLSTNWLRKRIDAVGASRPGVARLLAMVRARDPKDQLEEQSHLEAKLKLFLHRHGFPSPMQQMPIGQGDRHFGIFDFAYPRQKLVIEVDGYRHHSDRYAWSRDRRRSAALAAIGWRVLPVTMADFDEPERLAVQIRSALTTPLQAEQRLPEPRTVKPPQGSASAPDASPESPTLNPPRPPPSPSATAPQSPPVTSRPARASPPAAAHPSQLALELLT